MKTSGKPDTESGERIMMNAPNGFEPESSDCRATNRTGAALARGQLVQFDLANTDGDVSNNTIGDANGGFANVISPQAADLDHGVFGIVLDENAVADNKVCRVCLCGVVQALVHDTSASSTTDIVKGTPLGGNATEEALDSVVSAGDRVLAQALEDTVDASTPVLASVWFRGGGRGGSFGTN